MKAKIIFLDRDGVINKYPGDKKYVTSLKKFRFLPKVKKAIALFSKHGFKVFVISNQAGVGKGVYSQRTLDLITKKMLSEVELYAGKIEGVYYCTHRPKENCSCRKPRAGMLNAAARQWPLDLKNAYFIGDTISDVLTAKEAGCKSILVLSGKEKAANRKNWEVQPDLFFQDLFAAATYLVKQK
ncbi:MAG: HAD family hydrolase [Candidatus Omnitrophica bacterium]|nr:HAD family hydrolase [Candidatus Omnitrophota bacterium]